MSPLPDAHHPGSVGALLPQRLLETSAQLGDPVQVAERLATRLPVRICDALERPSPARPFRCHTGGLRLGPLTLVAIWGPGLRGEVDGTEPRPS